MKHLVLVDGGVTDFESYQAAHLAFLEHVAEGRSAKLCAVVETSESVQANPKRTVEEQLEKAHDRADVHAEARKAIDEGAKVDTLNADAVDGAPEPPSDDDVL